MSALAWFFAHCWTSSNLIYAHTWCSKQVARWERKKKE